MTHSPQDKNIWVWVAIPVAAVALVVWWNSGGQFASAPDNTTASSTKNASAQHVPTTSHTSTTVVGVSQGIPSASVFVSWLASTGVAAQLSGGGPYTIFLPTDASIGQLPKGTYNNLSAAEKKRFVEYHVVSGRAVNVDAQFSGSVAALSGDALNFSYGGASNVPMVDSAAIIQEFRASNGIVYLINNALLPPQKPRI